MYAISRVALLAVACASFLSPHSALAAPKAPPTPEQVVERYVQGSSALVARAGEALHRASMRAVASVQRLDGEGASNEVILRAGRRGLEGVGTIATRSLGGLRKMTDGALLILDRIGAADEFKGAVRLAAEGAAAAIRGSAEAAAGAIRAAVDAATAEGA